MSLPQALAFDVFGTVVDWRSSIIGELEMLGERLGLAEDWPTFADAWRGGYPAAMDRVRTGELPWLKIDELHRLILDDLLDRAGIGDVPMRTSPNSISRGTGSTRGRIRWRG